MRYRPTSCSATSRRRSIASPCLTDRLVFTRSHFESRSSEWNCIGTSLSCATTTGPPTGVCTAYTGRGENSDESARSSLLDAAIPTLLWKTSTPVRTIEDPRGATLRFSAQYRPLLVYSFKTNKRRSTRNRCSLQRNFISFTNIR